MIGLQEFEGTSIEPPEKPLKKWKTKFEGNILTSNDFIQYFQTASPFFFTIDQAADFSDLGERWLFLVSLSTLLFFALSSSSSFFCIYLFKLCEQFSRTW